MVILFINVYLPYHLFFRPKFSFLSYTMVIPQVLTNYESKFTLLWQYNYCSLQRSNNVLRLYFLCYAAFCFSWICKCFFSICLVFKVNLPLILFPYYMKSICHVTISVIFQLPKPIYWSSPLFSWRSSSELVVVFFLFFFFKFCYVIVILELVMIALLFLIHWVPSLLFFC